MTAARSDRRTVASAAVQASTEGTYAGHHKAITEASLARYVRARDHWGLPAIEACDPASVGDEREPLLWHVAALDRPGVDAREEMLDLLLPRDVDIAADINVPAIASQPERCGATAPGPAGTHCGSFYDRLNTIRGYLAQ